MEQSLKLKSSCSKTEDSPGVYTGGLIWDESN